jgi:hypothetical protein
LAASQTRLRGQRMVSDEYLYITIMRPIVRFCRVGHMR